MALLEEDAPAEGQPTPGSDGAAAPKRRLIDRPRFPAVALVLIYVTAVGVYAAISRRYLFPNLFPDEMIYGKLSQSFAAGHGLNWRGSSWGVPPLWPVVLSAAWHFGSTPQAYGTAKVLGAALASLTVF